MHPKNYLELIFTMSLFLVHLTIFTYLIGLVSSNVLKGDEKLLKAREEQVALPLFLSLPLPLPLPHPPRLTKSPRRAGRSAAARMLDFGMMWPWSGMRDAKLKYCFASDGSGGRYGKRWQRGGAKIVVMR